MKRYLPIIVWLTALLVTASALLYFEADFLWKIQECNLFLDTKLFFQEQMVVPGGLLSWAAAFQTQFFYHTWMGTLLLSCWWLLLIWLVKRAFRLPDQWMGVAMVPVGLLLLTIVDMGYWVYMLKLRGHVFVGTMGATAVAALLWAFRVLPSKYGLRPLFMVAVCAVGYPLMGVYGLGATLLMGVWIWRQEGHSRWQKAVYSLMALLSAVVVPLLCYRYVYYQTNLANIYYAELPLYYITEDYHAYYVPFYLLALFFLVLTIIPLKPLPPLKSITIQGVVLIALVAGVAHFWYKDENFHHEVAMQRCIEQGDWEGVVSEAVLQKGEPTRAIVMMRNLALGRLGRQGDEMYAFVNGSKRYEAPFDMRLMLVAGPLIYYHYGMLNYSSRLNTEMGVEFGWRVENLKLLAKCALLLNEQSQARKYLGLLGHTLFYKEWAGEAKSLPDLTTVRRMMHYENRLTGDNGDIESFLMNRLAECSYAEDPFFQEQTLLASLWTKDAGQFWYHFNDYTLLHPNARIPRYYQEAAYLYGKIEGRKGIDLAPFDDGVKQSFESFMTAAARFDNAEVDVARAALKAYRHTFYYDYYLMRQLPEY